MLSRLTPLRRLQHLSLSDCIVADRWDSLAALRRLKVLDLGGLLEVDNKLLTVLPLLGRLQILSLPGPEGYSPRYNQCSSHGFAMWLHHLRSLASASANATDTAPPTSAATTTSAFRMMPHAASCGNLSELAGRLPHHHHQLGPGPYQRAARPAAGPAAGKAPGPCLTRLELRGLSYSRHGPDALRHSRPCPLTEPLVLEALVEGLPGLQELVLEEVSGTSGHICKATAVAASQGHHKHQHLGEAPAYPTAPGCPRAGHAGPVSQGMGLSGHSVAAAGCTCAAGGAGHSDAAAAAERSGPASGGCVKDEQGAVATVCPVLQQCQHFGTLARLGALTSLSLSAHVHLEYRDGEQRAPTSGSATAPLCDGLLMRLLAPAGHPTGPAAASRAHSPQAQEEEAAARRGESSAAPRRDPRRNGGEFGPRPGAATATPAPDPALARDAASASAGGGASGSTAAIPAVRTGALQGSPWPHLRELSLRELWDLGPVGLAAVCSGLPLLRSLDLTGSGRGLDPAAALAEVARLTDLRRLRLARATRYAWCLPDPFGGRLLEEDECGHSVTEPILSTSLPFEPDLLQGAASPAGVAARATAALYGTDGGALADSPPAGPTRGFRATTWQLLTGDRMGPLRPGGLTLVGPAAVLAASMEVATAVTATADAGALGESEVVRQPPGGGGGAPGSLAGGPAPRYAEDGTGRDGRQVKRLQAYCQSVLRGPEADGLLLVGEEAGPAGRLEGLAGSLEVGPLQHQQRFQQVYDRFLTQRQQQLQQLQLQLQQRQLLVQGAEKQTAVSEEFYQDINWSDFADAIHSVVGDSRSGSLLHPQLSSSVAGGRLTAFLEPRLGNSPASSAGVIEGRRSAWIQHQPPGDAATQELPAGAGAAPAAGASGWCPGAQSRSAGSALPGASGESGDAACEVHAEGPIVRAYSGPVSAPAPVSVLFPESCAGAAAGVLSSGTSHGNGEGSRGGATAVGQGQQGDCPVPIWLSAREVAHASPSEQPPRPTSGPGLGPAGDMQAPARRLQAPGVPRVPDAARAAPQPGAESAGFRGLEGLPPGQMSSEQPAGDTRADQQAAGVEGSAATRPTGCEALRPTALAHSQPSRLRALGPAQAEGCQSAAAGGGDGGGVTVNGRAGAVGPAQVAIMGSAAQHRTTHLAVAARAADVHIGDLDVLQSLSLFSTPRPMTPGARLNPGPARSPGGEQGLRSSSDGQIHRLLSHNHHEHCHEKALANHQVLTTHRALADQPLVFIDAEDEDPYGNSYGFRGPGPVGHSGGCSPADDGVAAAVGGLMSALPSLEELDLGGWPVTAALLRQLVPMAGPGPRATLKRLGLAACSLSDPAAAALVALQGLRVIDISATRPETYLLRCLAAMPELEEVEVRGCRLYYDSGKALQQLALRKAVRGLADATGLELSSGLRQDHVLI